MRSDRAVVVFHLKPAVGAGSVTYFGYGIVAAVRAAGARAARRRDRSRAPRSTPIPASATGRISSSVGGAAKGCVTPPIRVIGAAPRRSRRSAIRAIPDPSTNLLLLQSGELDWNLRRAGAACRSSAATRAALRHRADRRRRRIGAQHAHTAARRRERSPRDRDVGRPRAISRKITLGIYPVTNMLQPQFSWAFDPAVREPDYDPARADRPSTTAGWRRGPDGLRRRDGASCGSSTCSFPRRRPAFASRRRFKRRCASAASTSS